MRRALLLSVQPYVPEFGRSPKRGPGRWRWDRERAGMEEPLVVELVSDVM
jgi:hypothetical protein